MPLILESRIWQWPLAGQCQTLSAMFRTSPRICASNLVINLGTQIGPTKVQWVKRVISTICFYSRNDLHVIRKKVGLMSFAVSIFGDEIAPMV